MPGFPPQKIYRLLQLHLFGWCPIDFQNLVARQDARFCGGGIFHRGDDRQHSVLARNFDAKAVETAAGVILHVPKIFRLQKLAMRIERSEHAFHRRVDQIVITGFVPVDVILPEQLYRLGKDSDLLVAIV